MIASYMFCLQINEVDEGIFVIRNSTLRKARGTFLYRQQYVLNSLMIIN